MSVDDILNLLHEFGTDNSSLEGTKCQGNESPYQITITVERLSVGDIPVNNERQT